VDLASCHVLCIEFLGGSDILENLWTPVDFLKSILTPLSRGSACQGNIFTFFSACELWANAQEKKLNMMEDSSELFFPFTRMTTSNDQRWKPR
jgi:hypothetical protein